MGDLTTHPSDGDFPTQLSQEASLSFRAITSRRQCAHQGLAPCSFTHPTLSLPSAASTTQCTHAGGDTARIDGTPGDNWRHWHATHMADRALSRGTTCGNSSLQQARLILMHSMLCTSAVMHHTQAVCLPLVRISAKSIKRGIISCTQISGCIAFATCDF